MVQGVIDELWVVAQLLQVGDSRQDSHRLLSRHQLARRLGLEEVVVQIPLEVCQLTANYFNDLGAQEKWNFSRIKRAQAHYHMHVPLLPTWPKQAAAGSSLQTEVGHSCCEHTVSHHNSMHRPTAEAR